MARVRKPAKAASAIRPLRSEADYEAALDSIERHFDHEPKPDTAEADRFDLLALVIEDYERQRWPIEPPDPVDAIRYRMETGQFSQADLGRLIGSRQRASDFSIASAGSPCRWPGRCIESGAFPPRRDPAACSPTQRFAGCGGVTAYPRPAFISPP
jgi:antitoxin component HigA of HigAB toxin-antitoxin module